MRKDWHEYFFDLAHLAASRATCPRLAVGAVVVKENRVVSMGYNGSPKGLPHCTEVGCLMEGGGCVRTTHAEANALLGVDRNTLYDAVMYCTNEPCPNCAKLIANSTIKALYYDEPYRANASALLVEAGIVVLGRAHLLAES